MRRRGFTLIELLATIAIAALVIGVASFFTVSYVNWAKNVSDKQSWTVLTDALNRYKCEGGSLTALTSGAPVAHVINAMHQPITWGGQTHFILEPGRTFLSRSIDATGNGALYTFTRYDT